MKREIQQRLPWVNLYEECCDVNLVCYRFGISRQTLLPWHQDMCSAESLVWKIGASVLILL